METTHGERGSTLIEALVAAGLLITLATGTASLILMGHRLGERTERALAATSLATARLEALRAIPWDYDLSGGAPEVPALALAPPGALDRNVSGYSQETDESGRPLSAPDAADLSFIVRWAIRPPSTGAPDVRAIEVCVFDSPGAVGTPPLTCLQSVRTRRP